MTNWLKLFPEAKRNRADFLLDGAAYFKSVAVAIETAGTKDKDKDYVYILGWMLDIGLQLVEDDPSKTLFNVLMKAAVERGVEIRILIADNHDPDYAELGRKAVLLVNALQNSKAFLDPYTFFPRKFKQHLDRIAGQLSKLIRSKPPFGLLRLSSRVTSIFTKLHAGMKALAHPGDHHEKVVIVKGPGGLIAYCGGMDFNINRIISGKEHFPHMHDTACWLEGPAAYEVLDRFKRRWRSHPEAGKESLRGDNEAKPKEAAAPYHYAKVVGTYTNPDGSNQDRSLRVAYLKIIENAKTYIYIEDPYLVNLDVAKALNKKIKEPGFQKLFLATQDLSEASEIAIPKRKRKEFYLAVISGATPQQQKKVLLSMIDPRFSDGMQYHPGMHAKTLIVDDEIAIIGSANVTQRSFTIESETCVVVFDEEGKPQGNFARAFRIATWKEFTRSFFKDSNYEGPLIYPDAIERGVFDRKNVGGLPYPPNGFSMLTKYDENSQRDLDEIVIDTFRSNPVFVALVVSVMLEEDELDRVSLLLHEITNDFDSTLHSAALRELAKNPSWVTKILDILWDEVIDPKAD